jgi:protein-S-isoprenylcysteine O-methyltransferase Ste14
MAKLALLLWLAYAIGALGIRVTIQLRRTGSTGLVGVRARPGSIPWLAEVTHTLALGIGVAAPVLALTGILEPIDPLDRAPVHALGVALFAVGLAGVIAGQAQMGDAWRIGTDPRQRTPLVTAGLFAIVRNPIYSSLIPLLLGLALLVPSVAALASVALFLAAIEIETRYVEEPHLRRLHGRDYDRYAARTGRFLPGVGLLPEQSS